jgi:GT2 family glycosyltransferase/uncharacterized coiled-coil protein SlyX/predicted O-methyltransferase YrrM
LLNPFEHPICFAMPERLVESAWHEHIPFAMFLVDVLKPKMIVELGTHYGESYCAFCQAVKQLNLDTRCYAIDTWRGDPHASFYGPEVLANLRAHHDPLYGGFSSLIQSTFEEALTHFGDGTISLLHIDAYHVYEAVKRDFETWLPKVSRDGVILFHDTNVRERDFGVRRFWDEIKEQYRHFEFIHGHGLGVLAPGDVRSSEFKELLNATGEDAAIIREFFFQLGNRLVHKIESEKKDREIARQALQLAEQQESAAALLVKLSGQDQAVAVLSAQVEEKQKTVSALNAQVAEGYKSTRALASRLTKEEKISADLTVQLAQREKDLRTLSADVAIKDKSLEALASKAARQEQNLHALSARISDQKAQLSRIHNTLGWRLLTLYGRRIKYPYLMPLYRLYGRIKYPHLLPIYKLLGLMPKAVGSENLPNRQIGQAAARSASAFDRLTIVKDLKPAKPLEAHSVTADVIVCVHNALEDVKRCLESVVRHTTKPYSLILVDDGSNEDTQRYLSDFANSHTAGLIRNERARGYTFAANQGMLQSTSDYVLLLNSDTVVTPGWLDRMIACGESDSRIGIVGPLSNAATWQSIPEIIAAGQFAANELPKGCTVSDMGRLVAQYSGRLYPRIPFLNGFCLMIKRRLIDEIGRFDEEAFGKGYGEENDYCLRASNAGWQCAVADDAYVHHLQSRSYSHERRKKLWVHSGKALAAKHGGKVIEDGVAVCRYSRVLDGVRARSQVMAARDRFIEQGKALWQGKQVLFVLPVSMAGGGSNVVLDEAEAMRKMGVDATILNLSKFKRGFEQSYPDGVVPVIYISEGTDLSELLSNYDAVIATWCASVEWLTSSNSGARAPVRGYYIQDFEPHFFNVGSAQFKMAWNSYTRFSDLVRVTKTEWNRSIVKSEIGVESVVVGPSVNIDLYRPRNQQSPPWPQRPMRIAAMIRPSSTRRAPMQTLEILRELYCTRGDTIEIILFGCSADDLSGLSVPVDFPCSIAGVLTRSQMANVLNEIDVFADFSTYQAMGLTAMEAMSCGAAVIVPQRGGSVSFVRDEENGLVVDTNSPTDCLSALERLVLDGELRIRLQRQALFDICQFFPERSAYNILGAMFKDNR